MSNRAKNIKRLVKSINNKHKGDWLRMYAKRIHNVLTPGARRWFTITAKQGVTP